MKLPSLLFLSFLLTSCKDSRTKLLKGDWVEYNIEINKNLGPLFKDTKKYESASFISFFRFTDSTLGTFSILNFENSNSMTGAYKLNSDTIIQTDKLNDEQKKAFPNYNNDFYLNKYKIVSLSEDEMVLQTFYHLDYNSTTEEYHYNLNDNYFTSTIKLRKLKDNIETNKILNYILTERLNMESSQSSSYFTTKNYIFVLLKVTQKEYDPDDIMAGNKDRHYNVCTQIQEYSYVNEDLKYKLLDDAQSQYLNSSSGLIYKGSVNSRECFIFNSYEEASKAREGYMINK